jgi:hypothetical protein
VTAPSAWSVPHLSLTASRTVRRSGMCKRADDLREVRVARVRTSSRRFSSHFSSRHSARATPAPRDTWESGPPPEIDEPARLSAGLADDLDLREVAAEAVGEAHPHGTALVPRLVDQAARPAGAREPLSSSLPTLGNLSNPGVESLVNPCSERPLRVASTACHAIRGCSAEDRGTADRGNRSMTTTAINLDRLPKFDFRSRGEIAVFKVRRQRRFRRADIDALVSAQVARSTKKSEGPRWPKRARK